MKKLAVLLTFYIIGLSFNFANANETEQEKCYCLVDNDCYKWIYVAKGSCVDVGGSLVEGQKPQE